MLLDELLEEEAVAFSVDPDDFSDDFSVEVVVEADSLDLDESRLSLR